MHIGELSVGILATIAMAFRNTRSSRAHWMAAVVLVALLVVPSLLTSTYAGTTNCANISAAVLLPATIES
jgi:hypothetical protein